MKHSFIQHWWSRLTGAQYILSTTVAEYRRPGTVLEIFGRQYRVTHVDCVDVWGRPVWWRSNDPVVVESPVKRQLHGLSVDRAN